MECSCISCHSELFEETGQIIGVKREWLEAPNNWEEFAKLVMCPMRQRCTLFFARLPTGRPGVRCTLFLIEAEA